jgi:hypothetical protein
MKLASRCPQVVLSAIALNFRRLSTARQQVLFDLLAHTRSTKKKQHPLVSCGRTLVKSQVIIVDSETELEHRRL